MPDLAETEEAMEARIAGELAASAGEGTGTAAAAGEGVAAGEGAAGTGEGEGHHRTAGQGEGAGQQQVQGQGEGQAATGEGQAATGAGEGQAAGAGQGGGGDDDTQIGAQPGQPPKRVRIEGLSDADRNRVAAATHLAEAEGIEFGEAFSRLTGNGGGQQQQAQAAAEEAQPSRLQVLEEEQVNVRKTLDEAGEERALFTKEVRDATRREAELILEIRDEKARLEAEQSQERAREGQTWEAKWDESVGLAQESFPDHVNNDNSPLNKAVVDEMAKIRADKSHRLFGNPELPEMLYAKHAARLKIAPKAKAAAGAGAGQGGQQVQTRMLPAGGGQRQVGAAVQNQATEEAVFKNQQAKAVAEGNDEELERLAELRLTGKEPEKRPVMRLS